MRGTVIDGGPSPISWAWGVMPIRVTLFLTTIFLLFTKGQQLLVAGAVSLTLAFLPLILILLFGSMILSKIGLGAVPGCLGWMIGSTIGKATGAGIDNVTRARPGWRFSVEHAGGEESIRFAGDAPLHEGHLVVVHGPKFRGIRDAWLVQGLNPQPFTRLGRGLIGTILQAALLVPVCIYLINL